MPRTKKRYKNIALEPQTYEDLLQLGGMNEDFDAVVRRLVRNYRGP